MQLKLVTCDICGDPITPGTRTAKQFVVNATKIDCCGAKCFLDFWGQHFDGWDWLEVSLSHGSDANRQLAILKNKAV